MDTDRLTFTEQKSGICGNVKKSLRQSALRCHRKRGPLVRGFDTPYCWSRLIKAQQLFIVQCKGQTAVEEYAIVHSEQVRNEDGVALGRNMWSRKISQKPQGKTACFYWPHWTTMERDTSRSIGSVIKMVSPSRTRSPREASRFALRAASREGGLCM